MLFFDEREYILFRIAGFVATGIVNKNKIHTLVFLFQKEVLKKELFEFRQGREGPYSSEIDEYLYNQDCFEVIDEYGKYIKMKNYGYKLILEYEDEFSEYNKMIDKFLYDFAILEFEKLKEKCKEKYNKYYPKYIKIF